MIRIAQTEDIETLVNLGRMFYESTILAGYVRYDQESIRGLITSCIANDNAFVAVLEREGMIIGGFIGCLVPLYWNMAVMSGQQIAWFVHPEYRDIRSFGLLHAFEVWAKNKGALMIMSGAKMDDSCETMDKMLHRRGFRGLEIMYIKEA